MSNPVSPTPPLPYPSGQSNLDLAAFDQDLVRTLYSYLSDVARRVNNALMKDGSEPMEADLDMGGFDITNVGNVDGVDVSTLQPGDADLTAIAALATTGFAARTAANTWALRTLTGTAAEISITNTAGVAGNPVFSLPAALTFTGKTITGGTFASGAFNGTLGATTPSTIVVSNGSAASPSINSSATTGLSFTSTAMTVSSAGTAHSSFGTTGFNSTRNGNANVSALIRSDNHGAGVNIAQLSFTGRDSGNSPVNYARIDTLAVDNTAGSTDGRMSFVTAVAGALASRMTLEQGMIVGSPTGGDKGVGTINVAGDIYKNDSAYTNPDYVFDFAYDGTPKEGYLGPLPLDELEGYTRLYHRLPGLTDEPLGMFERGDTALEKIEELSLYIIELHNRLKTLEAK